MHSETVKFINMLFLCSVKQCGPKADATYFQQKFGKWYSMS
jgi:hypothetical protein